MLNANSASVPIPNWSFTRCLMNRFNRVSATLDTTNAARCRREFATAITRRYRGGFNDFRDASKRPPSQHLRHATRRCLAPLARRVTPRSFQIQSGSSCRTFTACRAVSSLHFTNPRVSRQRTFPWQSRPKDNGPQPVVSSAFPTESTLTGSSKPLLACARRYPAW